ncbi:hypothetical protein [Amycolatopsis thailandensis]|nr:hypothetical protein [Amycolatopsis thailandensis]
MVLLLAFVCGAIVGFLTYLAARDVPAAILAGLAAAGGAIVFLHRKVR